MYTTAQVQKLFELAENLTATAGTAGAAGADRVVVDAAALQALASEVQRLKASPQQLMIGIHSHRHGQSNYLFLVPQGVAFGLDEFRAQLGDDYEPDREDEQIEVDIMDEPVLWNIPPGHDLAPDTPMLVALESIGYSLENHGPQNWAWVAGAEQGGPFERQLDAAKDAWNHAAQRTIALMPLAARGLDLLVFDEQVALMRKALGQATEPPARPRER